MLEANVAPKITEFAEWEAVVATVFPAASCNAPAAIATDTSVPAGALLPPLCVATIDQVLFESAETAVLNVRLGALE